MDDPNLDPTAKALRELPPAPHGLNRERLLFEAGRAAARNPLVGLWKFATGLFAASTLLLAFFLFSPQPREIRDYARGQSVEYPSKTAPATSTVAYTSPVIVPETTELVELTDLQKETILLRQALLAGGLDALETEFARTPPGLANLPPPGIRKPLFEPGDGFTPGGLFAIPTLKPALPRKD
jgi:hypothetical protein